MEIKEGIENITIDRKKKKDKKNNKKNGKLSDMVSCIAFLSKDQKCYSKKKQIYSDEESSEDKKIISEDLIISNTKKYIYEDELNIEKTDSIILNGKIYNDVGTLELHLFNYDQYIFNIYDDTIIDNYPLCMDIINSSYYKNTNLVAIGTLNKDIGLWDINLMDSLEPVCYLGNHDSNYENVYLNNKKNKKRRKIKVQEELPNIETKNEKEEAMVYDDATIGNKPSNSKKKKNNNNLKNELEGHTDSVTCINISKIIPNLLSSGSKDHTIKLWDLSNLKTLHTFDFHKKKINNLSFHEKDTNLLLSTSSDKTLKIYDIRKNKVGLDIELDSTPESTIWSKPNDYTIYLTDVHGYINKIDIRNAITTPNIFNNKKNIVKFKAFNTSCISLLNLSCNTNLSLAGSEDGIIKVFDFSKFDESEHPSLIYTRNIKKNLFFMKDNTDWPHVVFLGCDNLYDWDLKECEEISKHFKL
ncbi:periodic tryptophan protein 1, putative [Plasmodium berghei]|uniref:Periodic tryptophan protein 1, putative n=1 Tax=Plasmodium berghei TaxID=5821 RepID=A0A1C6YU75_PLABE|nr:periodic tryptophan protein 1, putative [Plasmodium berghei]SCO62943.1 periodic tryptophan protein 1, putative [Plasmodium berghei]